MVYVKSETNESKYYQALKEIKKIAGKSNTVTVSSSELGERIGMSQQSASRFILMLVEDGCLTRTMDDRKQSLKITEKGLNVLYSELSSLLKILGMESQVQIPGKVFSGLGEGRYYISRKNYIAQFQVKLDMIPYLGTLNLKVDQTNWDQLRRLRSAEGIHIDGFRTEDRTFGDVKAFRARINGIKGAVIMPERTVYTDVVEIISETFLREALDLNDGDEVLVEVEV